MMGSTYPLEGDEGKIGGGARSEVAFLLLDGVRRSPTAGRPEVVLCALGLTRDGTPHPLALRVVTTETEHAWRSLLRDLRADSIGPDLRLICSDGHPALVKAIHAVYPDVPQQISVAHRLLALARKVDARWRAACLAEARKIFAAPDRAAAVALFREWHAKWLKQGEFAVRLLEADLASCLTFYRFPPHIWNKIRTVNLVERTFREARRAALPAAPTVPDQWEEEITDGEAASPVGDALALGGERFGPAVGASAGLETAAIPSPPPPLFPDLSVDEPPVFPPVAPPDAEPVLPGGDDRVLVTPRLAAPAEGGPGKATVEPPPPAGPWAADQGVPEPESAPVSPPALALESDEAFEEWLLADHQHDLKLKMAVTFASLAGLIAGIVLSLGR